MAWEPDEIAVLRDMAVAGDGCAEIAIALRKTQRAVRDLASLLGLELWEREKLEWCDLCCSPRSSIDPKTGWCDICTARLAQEAQRIKDDEEEERLREEATRNQNQIKKERQRMREEFGANPRKYRQ